MRGTLWCLLMAAGLLTPLALSGQAPDGKQANADEKLLAKAELKSDGPALLEYLKSRTLTQDERERIDVLIAQLGSSAFKTREQATQALVNKGPVVLEILHQALNLSDPEVHRRAEFCIQKIKENDRFPDVPAAVVRLIGQRKPAGAVAALLAYLPFASNAAVADSIRGTLAKLAVQDGESDKDVVAALTDKEAARRAAAGEALVRAGAFSRHKKAIQSLLTDPSHVVRFRVATALAAAHDKEAMPVLINLLSEVTPTQAFEIEEILYKLAYGQSPPPVPSALESGAREKCRELWQAWWKDHAAAVDMKVLDDPARPLGFTTIILLDANRIVELYPNDTIRWQMEGLLVPLDVQVLDKGRVLVAEHQGNRITERNYKGDILWEYAVPEPQSAQRLPNGNTFISSQFFLKEIDAKGKEVFQYSAPDGIMKCTKLPGGEIICLLQEGRIVRLNAAGKQISGFRIDFGLSLLGGRLYLTPEGNAMVALYNHNKVVEFDQTGKIVWQVKVEQPIAAVRLPNGNTLVTSMSQNRAVEFDRNGAEVWQYRQSTRVTRAIRR